MPEATHQDTFTSYTADDVQRAAEHICHQTHGNQCAAWGQAVVLFHHGPGAAAALSTVGPVIDRYVIPGVSGDWRCPEPTEGGA